MKLVAYDETLKPIWNDGVKNSRNGTFLFCRDFMDYHQDRFIDASLLFYNNKGKLLGLFPASAHAENGIIKSHGGLTYGGFVLMPNTHVTDVKDMLDLAVNYYRNRGFSQLEIKPLPRIYESYPSDDLLYWLYVHGAKLTARGLSSTIDLREPLPFSTLRKRKVNEAIRSGYKVEIEPAITSKTAIHKTENEILGPEAPAVWKSYWEILSEVLEERHNLRPVHSLEEMLLLKSKFPKEIQLAVVRDNSGNVVAGTVLFLTNMVVHAQYIAAGVEGRENGALDLLFHHLIGQYKDARQRYFDFGISTEDHGHYLNEGLAFQKEGFGGRSVVYDIYQLML